MTTSEPTMTTTTDGTAAGTTGGGAPALWHCLVYRDAAAGIRFLTEGLGFEARAVHTDPADDSVVHHAELRWPSGGGVMLGTPREGPGPQHPGTGSAYCVTGTDEAVDRLHERALAHGGTSLQPPTDMDYGGRSCTVADPEGNRWSIGSYRGE